MYLDFLFSRQIFEEVFKYQILWNSVQWEPCCSVQTYRQTDRWTIMNKLMVPLLNFAKAPINASDPPIFCLQTICYTAPLTVQSCGCILVVLRNVENPFFFPYMVPSSSQQYSYTNKFSIYIYSFFYLVTYLTLQILYISHSSP
jgi:hypothetical protein